MANAALLIITHNSAKWLPALAASWRATLSQHPLPIEILIADAGSTDDTRTIVAREFPEAKILPLDNLGYGTAANRAAAHTSADYLIIANPDITFGQNFIRDLIAPLLTPLTDLPTPPPWHSVACIAPKLLNPDGTTQDSIGLFPSIGKLLADARRPRHQRKYIQPQPVEPGMVDWATGACLIIRRDVFLELNGFDEKFFLYVEEVDLQRRLWLSGRQTWFAPVAGAEVTHHAPLAARTPDPQSQRWAIRGTVRYFAKHASWLDFTLVKILGLAARRLSLSEALRSRNAWLAQSTK